MIRWSEQGVPPGVAAILSGELPRSDQDWQAALRYTDRFQLTFALVKDGPVWVRERVEADRVRNRARNARIVALLRDVQQAAADCGFVVLKGIAHWGLFAQSPDDRVQYDLDLYAPGCLPQLRRALEPFHPPSGYRWNGDYYDAAIPIEIDLHDRLWDEKMEGFGAPGLEPFWERRVWREYGGVRFQSLAPADALAHAALHMLKHALHGEARPAHALELASFLRHHNQDEDFWSTWRSLHPAGLRRLEAIAFRFAAAWFGCPLPEEAMHLPHEIERWFERYAASPVTAWFRPNKDELALNLLLAESAAGKVRIVGRRLFPAKLPRPLPYAMARGIFHLRALAPAVATMLRMRR
jgi:hypothetical protein